MFNVGLFELFLLMTIALVVLGPDKLLELARTLGAWYARFMRAKERLQNDVIRELDLAKTQALLQEELQKINQSKAALQEQMVLLQGQIAQNREEIKQLVDYGAAYETCQTQTPPRGLFFLLGDFDRRRRLPKAPFLPNYRVDPLLNATPPNAKDNA